MDRVILHSDCNSFYASVECLYHPEIRKKPVAVGGDVEQRHGIILAKNQLAKKFHIQTGEALWQARQKCPDLVIMPAGFWGMRNICGWRKTGDSWKKNKKSGTGSALTRGRK